MNIIKLRRLEFEILLLIKERGPKVAIRQFRNEIPYEPSLVIKLLYRMLGSKPTLSTGDIYASVDRLWSMKLIEFDSSSPPAHLLYTAIIPVDTLITTEYRGKMGHVHKTIYPDDYLKKGGRL